MLKSINFSTLLYGTVQIYANRCYDIGFNSIIKHIQEKVQCFYILCALFKNFK